MSDIEEDSTLPTHYRNSIPQEDEEMGYNERRSIPGKTTRPDFEDEEDEEDEDEDDEDEEEDPTRKGKKRTKALRALMDRDLD
jgi:transcription elongation factor SPT5